jgi:hypothetical protein
MGKIIASCGHELGPDEGPEGYGYPVSWEEYDGPDLVTCHATYCKACAEALEAYQGAANVMPIYLEDGTVTGWIDSKIDPETGHMTILGEGSFPWAATPKSTNETPPT